MSAYTILEAAAGVAMGSIILWLCIDAMRERLAMSPGMLLSGLAIGVGSIAGGVALLVLAK